MFFAPNRGPDGKPVFLLKEFSSRGTAPRLVPLHYTVESLIPTTPLLEGEY